jgi:hypothetical protein
MHSPCYLLSPNIEMQLSLLSSLSCMHAYVSIHVLGGRGLGPTKQAHKRCEGE